jgi:glycosyltransferase involved in cell wall biosynthesis
MKLSAYICAANVITLDYCLELAARSLLPVADELILCDNHSTDATPELMARLAAEHPDKIRLLDYPILIPTEGRHSWWTDWLNWTRLHCTHEMQLTLDADEVLDDTAECHAVIRESTRDGLCRWFNRLNFWRDGRSLIPDGACCGKWVARMGPSSLYMPSDEPDAKDNTIRERATRDASGALRIFHLGFLRRTAAFFAKSKIVQPAFMGTYDPRLTAAEAEGKALHQINFGWQNNLVPYRGRHPAAIAQWMKERGAL